MSSPEYVAARGVSGTAATAKASIVHTPAKRSLIVFLQSLSLEFGGLRANAEQIVEMFPERIGTETMLKLKMQPGQKYQSIIVNKVESELAGEDDTHYQANRARMAYYRSSASMILGDKETATIPAVKTILLNVIKCFLKGFIGFAVGKSGWSWYAVA